MVLFVIYLVEKKERKKIDMSNRKSGIGKFLVGVGVGAGLGILFAPQSGEETRKALKKKLNEFIEEVKNIDIKEVKDEFLNKVAEIKSELEDLDKEKVLKIAREKGEQLKLKAGELVDLAKEKGTPVLEGVANDVRSKAIDVVKDILKKLEEKN